LYCVVEVYTYFQRFPNDGWILKATVGTLKDYHVGLSLNFTR